MHLPEHRFGIAGGVAAVASLNPDLLPHWKEDKAVATLLESASRLSPPLVDLSVSTIGHVEYLWLWWLVTRDEATLSRVIRLSHSQGEVAHMAQALLINHVNIPRINEVLEKEGPSWQAFQQGVVDPDVQALAQSLVGLLRRPIAGRGADGDHARRFSTSISTPQRVVPRPDSGRTRHL